MLEKRNGEFGGVRRFVPQNPFSNLYRYRYFNIYSCNQDNYILKNNNNNNKTM